jgi:hypothetical protein
MQPEWDRKALMILAGIILTALALGLMLLRCI